MSSHTRLICAAILAVWAMPVEGHDIYSHVKNKHGVRCCDHTDCRPAHYRVGPWGVTMLIDNAWFHIPEDVIEYRALEGDTGETRGGHWCGRHLTSKAGSIYTVFNTWCAFLPPNVAFVGSFSSRQ